MSQQFDVLVIGAGHAGCEAALAAARMGCRCLMLTMTMDNVGAMSCNPAIGGLAKGHLVKEIDALGGQMGISADETAIQFRILNRKKGAAVQATRCQSDMLAYKTHIRGVLESQPGLTLRQAEVQNLLWERNRLVGARTILGEEIRAQAVVITTGTFLSGLIHIGHSQYPAGRAWEFPSNLLAEHLKDMGIVMGRLKTGTTPRLDKRTIDWSRLEEQPGDPEIQKFSFWNSQVKLPQVPCHITYTSEAGHQIIRDNLEKSAMYSGRITGIGPRYCPSIEDKISKFPDKDRHQIFLEPTSLSSIEIYPNGMSTSMPLSVQLPFMRSIPGLEKVEIIRPGYAIEYDFVEPTQLKNTLELKDYPGLFCAGQINGTSGYEEAAAQGLMAGINAALLVQGRPPFILLRNQAYIGVMIDDLVSKGTKEPYRMFTSRAEYRLLLREDNADQRLSPLGRELGLLDQEKWKIFAQKQEAVARLQAWLVGKHLLPLPQSQEILGQAEVDLVNHRIGLELFLKKPNASLQLLRQCQDQEWSGELEGYSPAVMAHVETEIKYAGYVERQESQVRQYLKVERVQVPEDLNYDAIGGLSNEVKAKLKQHRPQTLGQAAKISGVTPAAITILMVAIQKQSKSQEQP